MIILSTSKYVQRIMRYYRWTATDRKS